MNYSPFGLKFQLFSRASNCPNLPRAGIEFGPWNKCSTSSLFTIFFGLIHELSLHNNLLGLFVHDKHLDFLRILSIFKWGMPPWMLSGGGWGLYLFVFFMMENLLHEERAHSFWWRIYLSRSKKIRSWKYSCYHYMWCRIFWTICLNILNTLFFSSRIFLLGPSHHYYTPKCALSRATVYKTPIGDLPIDEEGIANFSCAYKKFDSCYLYNPGKDWMEIFNLNTFSIILLLLLY